MIEVGTLLFTRGGYVGCRGNAVVVKIEKSDFPGNMGKYLYTLVTDLGDVMRKLTLTEVGTFFIFKFRGNQKTDLKERFEKQLELIKAALEGIRSGDFNA